MQFEYFARQVLVEPTLALLPSFGVRSERLGVVSKAWRDASRPQQHVGETPEHVWPDRFALEAACTGAYDGPLQGGYAKMVRPEIHEPLGETGLGLRDAFEARHGVGTKQLLSDRLFDRFWRIALPIGSSLPTARIMSGELGWRGGFRRRRRVRSSFAPAQHRPLAARRLCSATWTPRPRATAGCCSSAFGTPRGSVAARARSELAAGAEPKTVECDRSGLGVRSDRHGAFWQYFRALWRQTLRPCKIRRATSYVPTAWGVSGNPSKIQEQVLTFQECATYALLGCPECALGLGLPRKELTNSAPQSWSRGSRCQRCVSQRSSPHSP